MVRLTTLCEAFFEENTWYANKTKENARRAFRYLSELVGNITVDRLDFGRCEKFRNWLWKSGRSKNTANMYLRALGPILDWAVQHRILRVNPAVGVKQFKVTQKPIRVYENWECERMYRAAPDDRWRAILLAARTTGLRRGELLNLTRKNIRQGFVYVEPKLQTKETWPWEPKDKAIRKVPLVDVLGSLLENLPCFYVFLTEDLYKSNLDRQAAGVLNEDRRKCPDLNFRRTFVQIQKRAFGRQIGDFHSLRKTYITEMANHLPQYFVMKLSGHSSSKTMTTYYTACRESMFDDARKIASREGIRGHLAWLQPERRRA